MLLVVLVLGGFVLLFGGIILGSSLLADLDDKDQLIAKLESDQRANETRLLRLVQARRKVQQWQAISMPPDAGVTGTRYRQFLQDLCRKNNLTIKQLPEGGAGLQAVTPRNAMVLSRSFRLNAEGTFARVVGFLRDFYSVNLPHQIKNMTLTARGAGQETRVEMELTIETLTLPNAAPRDHLMPAPDPSLVALEVLTTLKHGPAGLALGPWTLSPVGLHGSPKLAGAVSARDYTRLVGKNVFAGLTAPEAKPVLKPDPGVLKFVHLTDITANFIRREATLYNRLTNRHIRLRAEGGFDSFDVRDANDHVILKGKVEHIAARDVIFMVDGKRYAVHLRESLHTALERALSDDDVKTLLGPPTEAADGPPSLMKR
jgi:hypothetical protein